MLRGEAVSGASMSALTPYTRATDSEPDIIRIRTKTALPFLDIDIAPKVLTRPVSLHLCFQVNRRPKNKITVQWPFENDGSMR